MDEEPEVLSPEQVGVMALYGITRRPAYRYRYRDWQYSSLADAVSQAQREFATDRRSKVPRRG